VNKKNLDLPQTYACPGSIHELQNVLEWSVIVCELETFSVDEGRLSRRSTVPEPRAEFELSERLAAQEKEMIDSALRATRGRVFGPSEPLPNQVCHHVAKDRQPGLRPYKLIARRGYELS
jgi:DNA-binding NtrC family response regulator